MTGFLIGSNPENTRLTRAVSGLDQNRRAAGRRVVEGRPPTIFPNGCEIATTMTIGGRPEYLAVGFRRNRNMWRDGDEILVVIRTVAETDFETKLQKKPRTSGRAVSAVSAI